MSALAMALAISAPVVLADERSLFHFPGVDDFRSQKVARADRESEWPFTVEEGYLLCAYVMGTRAVYFGTPSRDAGEPMTRIILVSSNPFDLMVSGMLDRELIAPFDSIEQLIVRFAPFERLGQRLCDQPRGTEIGPGEL